MERDGHDKVRFQVLGKGLDEQCSQRIRQCHLPPILEQGDGVLKWRGVSIGSPDLGIVRDAGATVMTFVGRAMGGGRGRRKGAVTSWAGRSLKRSNVSPALAAEKRSGIVRERVIAGGAI